MKPVFVWIGLSRFTAIPRKFSKEYDNHNYHVRMVRTGVIILGVFVGIDRVVIRCI